MYAGVDISWELEAVSMRRVGWNLGDDEEFILRVYIWTVREPTEPAVASFEVRLELTRYRD